MDDPHLLPPDPEPRGSRIPLIFFMVFAIVGVGLVAMVGYLGFSTWNDIHQQVHEALEANEVVTEHLGSIVSVEFDVSSTNAEPGENTFVFEVEGTRATGRVSVDLITIDADTELLVGGTLRVDDGRTFPLGASWNREGPVPEELLPEGAAPEEALPEDGSSPSGG